MPIAEAVKDTERRRLIWRCRRGMLELDIVLQRFVAKHFDALNLAEIHAFDEMLELPDNDFWTLISTGEAATETARGIIKKLKEA